MERSQQIVVFYNLLIKRSEYDITIITFKKLYISIF